MKTTLILGSGISYVSGIPGISEITNCILNSTNIGKHTNQNYYLEGYLGYAKQPHLDHHVSECQSLLNLIKRKIEKFYAHLEIKHYVNYEDIYFVLKQIRDCYHLEYENPATISLIEELIDDTRFSKKDFQRVVNESVSLIESIVWQIIDKPSFTTSQQFDVLKPLIEKGDIQNIISLNHDLVLEKWLTENKISHYDGFGLVNTTIPEWKGFENHAKILKIYKVHGSVNWFYFNYTTKKGERRNNLFKLPANLDANRLNRIESAIEYPSPSRPALLIGTFNKMFGYLGGVHEILYDEAKLTINQSEYLIVSGYGFGDKGINTRLVNWLYQAQSKKIIIIHPSIENLKKCARGAFSIHFIGSPKVCWIEKKFEDIRIEEIISLLEKNDCTQ